MVLGGVKLRRIFGLLWRWRGEGSDRTGKFTREWGRAGFYVCFLFFLFCLLYSRFSFFLNLFSFSLPVLTGWGGDIMPLRVFFSCSFSFFTVYCRGSYFNLSSFSFIKRHTYLPTYLSIHSVPFISPKPTSINQLSHERTYLNLTPLTCFFLERFYLTFYCR